MRRGIGIGIGIGRCASNRLLDTMNPKKISFQITRSIACVVALIASEGPLSVIQKLLGMVCLLSVFHIHFILKVVPNEVEVGLTT